jgi:hypothetical protein
MLVKLVYLSENQQEKEITCNKEKLMKESTFFRNMFHHDFKERRQEVIQIHPPYWRTFHECIRFVETGKLMDVKNLKNEDSFWELYGNAEYFLIPKLVSCLMIWIGILVPNSFNIFNSDLFSHKIVSKDTLEAILEAFSRTDEEENSSSSFFNSLENARLILKWCRGFPKDHEGLFSNYVRNLLQKYAKLSNIRNYQDCSVIDELNSLLDISPEAFDLISTSEILLFDANFKGKTKRQIESIIETEGRSERRKCSKCENIHNSSDILKG